VFVKIIHLFSYTHCKMIRKSYRIFTIIVILIAVIQVDKLYAQGVSKNTGLDDYLYNGKVYSYYPPNRVLGIQFLSKKAFSKATLWIKGAAYTDVNLNYDVLNQKLLLTYKTSIGAQQIIALSLAYVDSFEFEHRFYIVERNTNDDPIIFQYIKEGNSRIKIFWEKRLHLRSSASGSSEYEFSEPLRSIYLLHNQVFVLVSRRGQFKKVFPKREASLIIKYMKNHHWKLSKMTDAEFLSLLVYINQLRDE